MRRDTTSTVSSWCGTWRPSRCSCCPCPALFCSPSDARRRETHVGSARIAQVSQPTKRQWLGKAENWVSAGGTRVGQQRGDNGSAASKKSSNRQRSSNAEHRRSSDFQKYHHPSIVHVSVVTKRIQAAHSRVCLSAVSGAYVRESASVARELTAPAMLLLSSDLMVYTRNLLTFDHVGVTTFAMALASQPPAPSLQLANRLSANFFKLGNLDADFSLVAVRVQKHDRALLHCATRVSQKTIRSSVCAFKAAAPCFRERISTANKRAASTPTDKINARFSCREPRRQLNQTVDNGCHRARATRQTTTSLTGYRHTSSVLTRDNLT